MSPSLQGTLACRRKMGLLSLCRTPTHGSSDAGAMCMRYWLPDACLPHNGASSDWYPPWLVEHITGYWLRLSRL